MEYLFKSDRLGFRTWQESDQEAYVSMNADPKVMEYFESVKSPEESINQIEAFQKHFADFGYTFYAVNKLDSQEFIGFIGFHYVGKDLSFCPCVEIGWRLKLSAWNKGYATEGAKRCLDYAFGELELTEIYSFTSVLNRNSERVMQKIGMEKVLNFDHPKVSDGHRLKEHVLYHISK